ncbi:unnamed protein product, partial [Ilex paraguariensis]
FVREENHFKTTYRDRQREDARSGSWWRHEECGRYVVMKRGRPHCRRPPKIRSWWWRSMMAAKAVPLSPVAPLFLALKSTSSPLLYCC